MPETTQEAYLVIITHFEGDPDRPAVPLVLANTALAEGHDVLVWVTMEGVKIAKSEAAGTLQQLSFPPLADLLTTFQEAGGRLGVCPPCAKTHGVTDETLITGAEWMGGAALMPELAYRKVLTF